MPDPAPPSDLDEVRAAFRLGWAIAELRGRYRPDLFDQPEPQEPDAPPPFARREHALPLANERKDREVRIEVFEAVKGLSKLLGVDPQLHGMSAITCLQALFEQMEDPRTNAKDRERLWSADDRIADLFYSWDAQLQDDLVVTSTRAAAYQLGRGLADTHWALYPERDSTQMGSWAALLGPERQQTIARLAARLSAYLGPLVTAAINGPFGAWTRLAASEQQRSAPTARPLLYRQGLLWRDLIRGERQPLELSTPPPKDVWRQLAMYREAVETLKVPLIVGGLASALLVAGAAWLAGGSNVAWLSTAITILGALGLTTASLYARAKTELTSLLSSLREQVQIEQVQRGANLCPAPVASELAQPPPTMKWLFGKR